MNRRLLKIFLCLAISVAMLTGITPRYCMSQEEPIPDWSGRIDFGYVQSSGNTDSVQVNLAAQTVRKTTDDSLEATGYTNYGETDGEESIDKGGMRSQYKYFHKPIFFSYYEAGMEYDDFQQLDMRSRIGTGIGRQFIGIENTQLSCRVGAAWIDENYQDTAEDNSFGAVALGLHYERKLTEKLVFTEKLSVDISMEDSEDVLVTSETGLRTDLTERLSLGILVLDKYDANPPGNLKENDLTVATSLGYSF